jgi:asparagine synthase (glutamine-hydrolysing)
MCGICGIVHEDPEAVSRYLPVMNAAIAHRGPDDEGYFTEGNTGLAMHRLSIIDLDTGHQPIFSANNRFVIIFNGEIYNYRELKKTYLPEFLFHTKSDTEVVVNLFQKFGARSLDYLRGMFAFAIYDREERSLFIARDRLGIKPLTYYWDGVIFLFSSESKSFAGFREIDLSYDYKRFNDYLVYGYFPHPYTIYKNVRKLSPGHYMVFQDRHLSIQQYWDLDRSSAVNDTYEEAREKVAELMGECVEGHMVSDVPVAAFLSGGIDSSVITWEMSRKQKHTSTFTIGFTEASSTTDLTLSRLVSSMLETSHTETILDVDVMADYRQLISKMDEPFAVTSLLPLHLNSRVAKEHVKVALSGDGADELFGGYGRYRRFQTIMQAKIPEMLPRKMLDGLARLVASGLSNRKVWKGYHYMVEPYLVFSKAPSVTDKYLLLTEYVSAVQRNEITTSELSEQFEKLVYSKILEDELAGKKEIDFNDILKFDLKTSLVDEMLAKGDQASMLASLELRVPFLDHRLVEYVTRLPFHFKVGRTGKQILKEAYIDRLPGRVLSAPKRGFNMPLEQWIVSGWKDEFAETFASPAVEELGFDRTRLGKAFKDFCRKKDSGKLFFYLFCLFTWHNYQKTGYE